MADVHDKATRSYNMSRIKGKDTKPEMLVRKFLHANGYRYRLHSKDLPGKPDIVLPKYRTIIFINGCFWHGHEGCKFANIPKSNQDYWMTKIVNNISKDSKNIKELKQIKWNVITIWECNLKPKKQRRTLEKLLFELDHNEIR